MEREYYQISYEQVFEKLETDKKGLTQIRANERLQKNGKNIFKEIKKRNKFLSFLMQFNDIFIYLLIASGIISIIVGALDKDYFQYIDAGIIFIVVLVNAIIGFIQEIKANDAMEALKKMTKPSAKVIRDGKPMVIKAEELVIGDIVVLEAGDSVPADLRLFEVASLKIDEGALTGESLTIEKDAKAIKEDVTLGDRLNMAYMGTVVTYGRGRGVVVATGMDTEIGKIADLLHKTKNEETPLTKRIKKTNIYICIAMVFVCMLLFIFELIKGSSIVTTLVYAIVVAVCAVPEGLPACITITMAKGVKEMSRHKAIVKNLSSVETLGSTQVICSDKTGTLTLNKMVVKDIFTFSEEGLKKFKTAENKKEILDQDRNLKLLVGAMLLCNDSELKYEDEKLTSIGDPTEVALSEYGYGFGIFKEEVSGRYPRVDEIPFDSDRKLMTTLNQDGEKFTSFTKGAVDNLILKCDRVLINGKIEKFTNEIKDEINKKTSEMAGKALRILGFAVKFHEHNNKTELKAAEEEMIFVGLVGMMDPPREEVFSAVETCKSAGITTIMITGDHKETAFAIAKELGITDDERQVITGKELSEISDEEFLLAVNKYRVYARVSPGHKVKIVEALKKNGKVVAMTGDGVNDAPSIRRADIGIGMGITGTDVTKEAADVILTDDNFATIVSAVKHGRQIYDNILKLIQFLIGTSVAELIIMVAFISFFGKPYFTPALILYFNLVSDTLVALGLGVEKPDPDVMNRPPRKNGGSLFTGLTGFNIMFSAVMTTLITFGSFIIATYALGLTPEGATSMSFVSLVFVELFHTYNLKNESSSIFSKGLFNNKVLNISFVISAMMTVLLLMIPSEGFRSFFGIAGISLTNWAIAIGLSMLIIPFMEINKFVLRLIRKKKNKNKNPQ